MEWWGKASYLGIGWRSELDIVIPRWWHFSKWKHEGHPRIDIGLGFLTIQYAWR